MARKFVHKCFAAFLLLFSLTQGHAVDTGKSEIDMEMLIGRNQLLESMYNESLKLTEYLFERAEEICKKLLDEELGMSSGALAVYERSNMRSCVHPIVSHLNPKASRRRVPPDDTLLRKYGSEDIRKVVNQKYEELYKEIVRQIDEYLKRLTPEQARKKTARNLRRWSFKIKYAPTLARKEMAFGRCMRYYYFEGGV